MENKLCLWCKKTIYVGYAGYCLDCQNELDTPKTPTMSLTQEDKQTINRINELLTELKPLLYDMQEVIKPDCFAPKIEEQSYKTPIIALKEAVGIITKGKEYMGTESPFNKDVWYFVNDMGREDVSGIGVFQKATTAQQEPKELINESKGERYQVSTGNNEHGYEVLVLGISTIGKAEQIKYAIQELLKTS